MATGQRLVNSSHLHLVEASSLLRLLQFVGSRLAGPPAAVRLMVLSLQLCVGFAFQPGFRGSSSGCHACVARTYSYGGIFPAGGVSLRHAHTV